MNPLLWQNLFRVVLAVVTPIAITLVACTPPGGVIPPPQNDGPSFVINSPGDGASVSGATFFSVQPFDPNAVQSVSFTAGGAELASDTPGEDTFKVFLIPDDFPDGELVLTAVVTGQDGSRAEKSVTVNVVANPPSSATVTPDGAILGTREANGALSTLSIRAGAAEGAVVDFEARTQDEVKAETGVDYDALGVTFLGAQEIASSKPLDKPVGVSSGGFGPMVQPGQAVVNYAITPDSDGDGVGELMALNTASVAPNGDVVSDPVPHIQLGAASSTSASAAERLTTLQAGMLSGPPGTFIEIEATGFNTSSALGNVAILESSVDGTEIELPALVNSHFENENAVPTIGFYIPLLTAGAATVALKNVSTNETTAAIAITVEAPPALTEEPAVIIDETLGEAITVMSENPDLEGAVSKLEEVRAQFAELGSNPKPEETQLLNDIAVFVSNSNMDGLLSQIEAASGGNLGTLQQCLPGSFLVSSSMAGFGLALVVIGGALLFTPVTAPITATAILAVSAGLAGAGTGTLFVGVLGMTIFGTACLVPPPPEVCLPPYTNNDLAPSLPQDVRAQQASSPLMTGMGSIFPPGGEGCGSAVGGIPDSGDLSARQNAGSGSLFDDMAGRFIVKVFFGGSNVVPFTGVSDSSGYFYIPIIPAGQPFEAIAFDVLTGETRSFSGTGPEVGTSTYMFFDFLSAGESGAQVLSYDTNTEGVLDGLDIFLFEGEAGDLINLAWIMDGEDSPFIEFHLSDASGQSLVGPGFTPVGYHETGLVELSADGLYTLTLDSSSATRNYTLGLARIEPPTAFDVTTPLKGTFETLGDVQYFSFDGELNSTLDVTLSHDAASSLNVELRVLEPSEVPFYEPHDLLSSAETDDSRRSVTTGARILPESGAYLLELDTGFFDDITRVLGSYQIDMSLTP